jgi:SAM-dependent methyltransferase
MFRIEEKFVGNFDLSDPEIDFYLRIRSLLNEDSKVLDLGAGRASWFENDYSKTKKFVRYLKPVVSEIIGADLDPVVLENRSTTSNVSLAKNELPFKNETFDVIIADYVFEHVSDPERFAFELNRVLKKGGWICARTPHKFHYVAFCAKLIPEYLHAKALKIVKPDRLEQDSFSTYYKLNDLKTINTYFASYNNRSFVMRLRPFYYFNSKIGYVCFSLLHKILPKSLVGNIFFFLQKK